MSEPAASVIIPVYNGEQTLVEQLEALARQTTKEPFEVLVCDNGSTDGTRRVAIGFADRLDLRIIDASGRQGPSHARNQGILAARGELLVFCDADDVVADDWLEQMLSHAEPGLLMNGWLETCQLNPGRPCEGDGIGREPLLRAGYLVGIDTSNFGILRQDARSVRGFDESFRYVEDVDFAWRAQQQGLRVEGVPALVHSRFRESPTGHFRQRRNWGRYGMRLHHMNRDRAPMPMSFRYTATTLAKTSLSFPVTWLRSGQVERQRLAGTMGSLLGEMDAHIRYRLLGRELDRELLPEVPSGE